MGKKKGIIFKRLLWGGLLVLLLLGVSWATGLMGWGIRRSVQAFALPAQVDKDFIVLRWETAAPPTVQNTGLRVEVPVAATLEIAKKAGGPLAHLLPPNLLKEGTVLRCMYAPKGDEFSEAYAFPVDIYLVGGDSKVPVLRGNFPSSFLNDLVLYEFEDDFGPRLEDGPFGKFALSYKPLVWEAQLDTVRDHPHASEDHLQLNLRLKGGVKLRYHQQRLKTTLRGDISEGRLTAVAQSHPAGDGTAYLSYEAHVPRLKVNVKHTAHFIDKEVGDTLKKRLLRSLNKPKRQDKLKRRRFPDWIPLNWDIHIDFVPPEDGRDKRVRELI